MRLQARSSSTILGNPIGNPNPYNPKIVPIDCTTHFNQPSEVAQTVQ